MNYDIKQAINLLNKAIKTGDFETLLTKIVKEYAQIGDSDIFGGKHCGSDAEHQGAEYICKTLLDEGIHAEMLPFQNTRFQFNRAEITVPGCTKTIQPYACLSPSTPEAGLDAEVIDVKDGDKKYYSEHDISGKIALIETKEDFEDGTVIGAFQMFEAEKNGAAGIILFAREGILDGDTIRATYSILECKIPVVTISYNDAKTILSHIKNNPGQSINLKVDTEFIPDGGTSYNVLAEIKGTTDKHIVYSCHLDHFFRGIQDNVSSVAAVLAIAKAIKDSGYKPKNTINFLFTASHEIGKLNSAAPDLYGAWYFLQNTTWRDKILANINFEYCGLETSQLRAFTTYEMHDTYLDFIKYMPDRIEGLGAVSDEASPNDYYLMTWADSCAFIINGTPVIMNDTIHDQIYNETSPYIGRDHTNRDDLDVYSAAANAGNVLWYGCLGMYLDNLPCITPSYSDRASVMKLTEEEKAYLDSENIPYEQYEKQLNLFESLGRIVSDKVSALKQQTDDSSTSKINDQLLEVQRLLAQSSDGLTTSVPSMLQVPHKVYIQKGQMFQNARKNFETEGFDNACNRHIGHLDGIGLAEKFSSDMILLIKQFILGKNSTWNSDKCLNFFTKEDISQTNFDTTENKNKAAIRESLEQETGALKDIVTLFIKIIMEADHTAGRKEMMNWIKEFTRFPHRKTGSAYGLQSAEYVKSVYDKLGLSDSKIEEIPSVCWECDTYKLTVEGEEIECFPANGTNRGAETGHFESIRNKSEVIYLGRGKEEDFKDRDITGKIVVCDIFFKTSYPKDLLNWCEGAEMYDPDGLTDKPLNKYDIYTPNDWPYNYARAMRGGAAGFVGILHNYMDCRYYHEDYIDIVDINGYMELPAVWVSRDDGTKLKELLCSKREAGQTASGTLDVRTDYVQRTAKVVSARLKGQSDEIVLIHSHHDAFCGGAVQDASGMSVTFAIADFFTKLPEAFLGKTLMFISTDSHFTDYEGQVGFIQKRNEAKEKIIYDFAIEHIGKEMELDSDNNIILHDEPETRMLYVDKYSDGLLELVREAVKRFDLQKTVLMPAGKSGGDYTSDDVCSDAYDFNANGIPVVSLVAGPMYIFHYSDDIDKVHQESLDKTLMMFIYIILNSIS